MATSYKYDQGLKLRHRSQSDSDLLNPHPETNGSASMVRMGSVEELSPNKKGRTRRFFHRLVRPWKWRIKRKYKDTGKREMWAVIWEFREGLLSACLNR